MNKIIAPLLSIAFLAGCGGSHQDEADYTDAANTYIQRIGGMSNVVNNIAASYSISMPVANYYDPESEMVTHDADGKPRDEWLEHREQVRSVIRTEMDTNIVYQALVSALTNTFSVAEIRGLNSLSDEDFDLAIQIATKMHFMKKPMNPEEKKFGFPPVTYTKEEKKALRSFSRDVRSALEKLNEKGNRFLAGISSEYTRVLTLAKERDSTDE